MSVHCSWLPVEIGEISRVIPQHSDFHLVFQNCPGPTDWFSGLRIRGGSEIKFTFHQARDEMVEVLGHIDILKKKVVRIDIVMTIVQEGMFAKNFPLHGTSVSAQITSSS
eukprot:gene4387-biopygen12573